MTYWKDHWHCKQTLTPFYGSCLFCQGLGKACALSPSFISFQNGSLILYLVSPPVSFPHPYPSCEKWLPLFPRYPSLISGYKNVKLGDWATMVMLLPTILYLSSAYSFKIQKSSDKVIHVRTMVTAKCALEKWHLKQSKQEEKLEVHWKGKVNTYNQQYFQP